MSNILLQADAIKQGTDFSPVHSFANNLRYANFKLYVNPGDVDTQDLFRLSGGGQMPLHKCRNTIRCALSDQGSCGLLDSKNPAARRSTTIGIALMQYMEPKFRRVAH